LLASATASIISRCSTLIALLVFAFSFSSIYSQYTSIDNNSGLWTDNGTWVGGVAPPTIAIVDDVNIYGTVTRQGNISVTLNAIHVYDTLIIYGNLVLDPLTDLIVEAGGVLIIYGDYWGIGPDIGNSGTIAVLGTFNILDLFPPFTVGEFLNDGNVYIPNPGIIPPFPGYEDLDCPDPNDYPDNCGYGNQDDLENDPIWDIIVAGGYEIVPAGPLNICDGNSITLSIRDDADSYQWYRDGAPIAGATGFEYDVTLPGDYTAQVTVGVTTFDLNTVTVNVIPLPDAGIITSSGALIRR
jgi:hypothetical protein